MKALAKAYKLRLKRRRLLLRALRKRRELAEAVNRTEQIATGMILCFSTVRNEMLRLPHFLQHYRNLGIGHFLFVDNGSNDGTADYLRAQPDVSLWQTQHSYKAARFGMDWLVWLLFRYGHGHWCLTVDADEILIYPFCDTRTLSELTHWLDRNKASSFGSLLLDLYPKGALGQQSYQAGKDPFELLRWFDGDELLDGIRHHEHHISIRGGVRARVFFHDQPQNAPDMNKIPLVKWRRPYVYASSTHSLLPAKLNDVLGTSQNRKTSGVLLHSKFLPDIVDKSAEEIQRKEHFSYGQDNEGYYHRLCDGITLWSRDSVKYTGWEQLETMQLMSRGRWR